MTMENRFLVRSTHLNHQGHLFGGDLMAEIDNLGYCLIRESYPDHTFVTRAAEIAFESPARIGDVITFQATLARVGTTSAHVEVVGRVRDRVISRARLVYVNIGPDGRKRPIEEGTGDANQSPGAMCRR